MTDDQQTADILLVTGGPLTFQGDLDKALQKGYRPLGNLTMAATMHGFLFGLLVSRPTIAMPELDAIILEEHARGIEFTRKMMLEQEP